MIHVDTSRLGHRLPRGWLKKAANAQLALDRARTPAQVQHILKTRPYWQELTDLLRAASHEKCWYSEARNEASRMDVDHFRPKGMVRDSNGTTRPGYPFLAYDFRNYRLSAQLPNQATKTKTATRGKHQQFPLENFSQCATNKRGISTEKPLLLDPTNPADPLLLTFDEEGKPRPTVTKTLDPRGYERAKRTIDVLWLDRIQFSDVRKAEWTKTHQHVRVAERTMCRARGYAAAGRVAEAEEAWEDARALLHGLREAAQPTAPYARATQACLFTSGYGWARRIAERAEQRSLVIA